jgi:hypothetical protein
LNLALSGENINLTIIDNISFSFSSTIDLPKRALDMALLIIDSLSFLSRIVAKAKTFAVNILKLNQS